MFNFEDHIKVPYRIIRNQYLKLRSFSHRQFTNKEYCRFQCNICGKYSHSPTEDIEAREKPSCYHCGSTLRLRSIIAALSWELFGQYLTIDKFPNSMTVRGIGMSDNNAYARRLKKKFSYENTFLHKEPFLDITKPESNRLDSADFLISSDVFEHVPPPVHIAFDNLFDILKKGGIAILSVPFTDTGDTREHFADLYDYKIISRNGKKILINKMQNGKEQVFENLRFHGGCGDTLEMRVFSRPSLVREIEKAGFHNITFHDSNIPEYGILNNKPQSPVITMRR